MEIIKSVSFLLLLRGSGISCLNDQETEILRDNFGIPHIYTENDTEMFVAIGYAQMNYLEKRVSKNK